MSLRNQGGLDTAFVTWMRDMERRVRVSLRRPVGTGDGGGGICDCEDGHSIQVFEQPIDPGPLAEPGDIWIVT